jgi:hypothetical protein
MSSAIATVATTIALREIISVSPRLPSTCQKSG